MNLRVLFIGDICARTGREYLSNHLKDIKEELGAELCIANGENASHGRGLSLSAADQLYLAGVDFITMGNHTWGHPDILQYIQDYPIIRPANFAPDVPGRGSAVIETPKGPVGILNLQGRVYMDPCDSPFTCGYALAVQLRRSAKMILVDFHAEATAEKCALAYYLDGLVSAVIGTHTHVQTADEHILPQGTAFITDAGMTGPSGGVIGMDRKHVLDKFIRVMPRRFEPAAGAPQFNGVLIDIDPETGRAVEIRRITKGGSRCH